MAPTTATYVPRHAATEAEPQGWAIPAHYLTPDTIRCTHVMLVPLWVAGIGDYTSGSADALPLAVGIVYRDEEGDFPVVCDTCLHADATAMDEQGTTYCAACLMPNGEQYGIVQTSRVLFVPADE